MLVSFFLAQYVRVRLYQEKHFPRVDGPVLRTGIGVVFFSKKSVSVICKKDDDGAKTYALLFGLTAPLMRSQATSYVLCFDVIADISPWSSLAQEWAAMRPFVK